MLELAGAEVLSNAVFLVPTHRRGRVLWFWGPAWGWAAWDWNAYRSLYVQSKMVAFLGATAVCLSVAAYNK